MNNKTNNNKRKRREVPIGDFVPKAVPTEVPRFEVDDKDGYKYLEDNGYVVFKNVATPEEVEKGIALAWNFIESLDPTIKRDDPKTWDSPKWPDPFGKGILTGDAIGQSEFLWFCRGLPKVQQIFQTIWETKDVATSFDGCCMHRSWEYNESWKTKDGVWYHLDQNGHNKPKKICVQGLLNFYECGLEDGGLVVIPKSLTIFNSIFTARPHFRGKGDYISLTNDKSLWENEYKKANLTSIKPCAKAGDFLLWDSRTIHCNSPALTPRKIPTTGVLPLRRLVAYVCMTPQSRLTMEVRSARRKAYQNGDTTSHWPEECLTPSVRKNRINYKPVELSDAQKKLIPM